jgi:hypothetical protein
MQKPSLGMDSNNSDEIWHGNEWGTSVTKSVEVFVVQTCMLKINYVSFHSIEKI